MKKWKSNDIDAQAAAGLVSVFALVTEDFLKQIQEITQYTERLNMQLVLNYCNTHKYSLFLTISSSLATQDFIIELSNTHIIYISL